MNTAIGGGIDKFENGSAQDRGEIVGEVAFAIAGTKGIGAVGKGVIRAAKSIGNLRSASIAFEEAATVTEGGIGNVFAGHGSIEKGASSLTIPKGTSLTVWSKNGSTISDKLGLMIEQGRFEQITQEFGQLEGAVTHLPGATIPRMVLYPPTGLNIMSKSITVSKPTYLNKLLKRNMGNTHWAACLCFE